MRRMRHLATIVGLALMAALATACSGTDALNLMPRLSNNTAEQQENAAATEQTAAAQSEQTSPAASQEQPGATASQQMAAVSTGARVQFAPVIGATTEAVGPLSSRLSERARQRGLAVVQQSSTATHVLKGYFSAIADGNQTTVIYVWDVLGPSGSRLHRIQGQQKAAGSKGDGWSSVTDQTMQAIADKTIDELAAWLAKTG